MLYTSNSFNRQKLFKQLMAIGCALYVFGMGSHALPAAAEPVVTPVVEPLYAQKQNKASLEVVEQASTIEAIPEFDDRLPYEELRRFASVFAAIKNRYVEPVENAKLVEAAINGMMDSLDPHSSYLNEEAFAGLQEATEGSFGGLGIEIEDTANKEIEIISPIEDSPAAKAGIMPGDVIVKVDGVAVTELPLSEVVKKLRGEPGSGIVLTVRRGAEILDFEIVRDLIKVQSVRSKMLERDIAYIRISQFQERTVEDLVKHLNGFKTEPKALVLDLRNDPGGLLNAAVGVAGAFIEPEKLVVYTKSRGEVNLRYRVVPSDYSLTHRDPLKDLPAWSRKIPMVLLINVGSASASEIVAGALQDYQRATIMGNRSFGKGSVQVVMALGDNTGVKLTIARYYTPNDRSIQATGIEPDIVVTDTENGDFFSVPREADLRDHLVGDDEVVSSQATSEGVTEGVTGEVIEPAAVSDTESATGADEAEDIKPNVEEVDEIESETAEDGAKIEMYTFGSDEDYQLQQAVKFLIGEYLESTE